MSLYRHVLYSWLLSIVITLTGLFVYALTNHFHQHFDPGFGAVTLFGSFLVALPSLFIAFIFFRFICSISVTVYEKFLLWYVLALLAVALNVLFIPLLFMPELIDIDLFLEPWPAYAGLIAALTIRYRYFLLFFKSSDINKDNITSDNSQIDQSTIL